MHFDRIGRRDVWQNWFHYQRRVMSCGCLRFMQQVIIARLNATRSLAAVGRDH